jgi:hypothetical protein
MQRLAQDWKGPKPNKGLQAPSPRVRREKKVFWRGLIGGASLSLFLLLLGWALYSWFNPKSAEQQLTKLRPSASTPNQTTGEQQASTTVQPVGSSTAPNAPAKPASDPFAEAVRLAEETVKAGKSAQTSAEWLEVASRWQRASDLMGQIASSDPRYPTAQDRVQLYRQNSETALEQAQKAQ